MRSERPRCVPGTRGAGLWARTAGAAPRPRKEASAWATAAPRPTSRTEASASARGGSPDSSLPRNAVRSLRF